MGVSGVNLDELFGMAHGQRPKQQGINYAEDRRVYPQAEGDGEKRHDGKARCFYQHPQSKAKISYHMLGIHLLDFDAAINGANFYLCLGRAAD